jgi:hypothetical protein
MSTAPIHKQAPEPYGPDKKTDGLSKTMREFVNDQARIIGESGYDGLVLVSTNTLDLGMFHMAKMAECKSVPKEPSLQLRGAELAVIISGSIRPSDDNRAGCDPLIGRLLRIKPNEYFLRLDSPTHFPFFLECSFTCDFEGKTQSLISCSGRADVEPLINGDTSTTKASYPMLAAGNVSIGRSVDDQWLYIRDSKNPWFCIELWIPNWMRLRRSARLIKSA